MAKMNMIAALNSALAHQLEKDPNVVIFGEDVGYFGGVFRVTLACRRSTDRIGSLTHHSPKVASLPSPWVWD